MEAYAKKKKIIINVNVKMDIWATIAKVTETEIMYTFTLMSYPLPFTCNSEMFADETVLYRHITSIRSCEQSEEDLRSASDWSNRWFVTLKAEEKCKAFHVFRKKDLMRHQYFLDNTLLSSVGHHKHLVMGVWIESSLSWSYHISTICAKTTKVLGLIRRTFGSRNPVGKSHSF